MFFCLIKNNSKNRDNIKNKIIISKSLINNIKDIKILLKIINACLLLFIYLVFIFIYIYKPIKNNKQKLY